MENIAVNDKLFSIKISLRQDELLAPIISELLKEMPDALSSAGKNTLGILSKLSEAQTHVEALASKNVEEINFDEIQKNIEATQSGTIAIAMDMIRVNAWIYAKGYAKKIMAILLTPSGSKFDESKISELETFFGEHADRETANEVINYFFQRSGVFGIGMQAFLPKATTK